MFNDRIGDIVYHRVKPTHAKYYNRWMVGWNQRDHPTTETQICGLLAMGGFKEFHSIISEVVVALY